MKINRIHTHTRTHLHTDRRTEESLMVESLIFGVLPFLLNTNKRGNIGDWIVSTTSQVTY